MFITFTVIVHIAGKKPVPKGVPRFLSRLRVASNKDSKRMALRECEIFASCRWITHFAEKAPLAKNSWYLLHASR
jgi:hypothetical protein